MEINKADIVGQRAGGLAQLARRLADNQYAGDLFQLGQGVIEIAVGELDGELFALGFNTVANGEIVRVVNFQLLLVAVQRQDMMMADGKDLRFTRAAAFIFKLLRNFENAMLSLFFYVQGGIVV